LTGPGSFVAGSTCTTNGGSCSIQITSAVPGVTTIKASTTVVVGGVTLTRATGDTNAGDSASAQKTWVDANIQISPLTATNEVGTPHTFTAHVNVNTGTGGYVSAPDGTTITFSITNGPGSFVGGVNTCTTAGGTGSCSVQVVSSTPGVTTISA